MNKPADQIERELCLQLERVRLQQNIKQSELAELAGVSKRTVGRMENGEGVSLNTFIRVMNALGLGDQFQSLIPQTDVRPIERVREKQPRQRASSPRKAKTESSHWEWGES